MSKHRRRTFQTSKNIRTRHYEPAWDPDYVHPELPPIVRHVPDDWQTAWADTTIHVCELIWNKHAYQLHPLNPLARDDLWSWLWVKACEFATTFTPKRVPDAREHWGASLYSVLRERVRWHWAEYHGVPNSIAAQQGAPLQVDSIERLLDRAHGTPSMHGVHAHVLGDGGLGTYRPIAPERFVLLVETADDALAGKVTPLRKPPGTCVDDGCWEPAYKGDRCSKHTSMHRRHWGAADGALCSDADCERPAFAKGLCTRHYNAARRDDPTRPRCIEDGCDQASDGRGLCPKHRYQWKRDGRELPPGPRSSR